MEQSAAIYTVAGTLLCGFGLIGLLAASIERRSVFFSFLMICGGVGCAVYAYMLQPETSLARLPLAFVEVLAMLTR